MEINFGMEWKSMTIVAADRKTIHQCVHIIPGLFFGINVKYDQMKEPVPHVRSNTDERH